MLDKSLLRVRTPQQMTLDVVQVELPEGRLRLHRVRCVARAHLTSYSFSLHHVSSSSLIVVESNSDLAWWYL